MHVISLGQETRCKILPDCISCPHSHPLGNWPVLLQFFGEFSLDDKGLMGRLKENIFMISYTIRLPFAVSSFFNKLLYRINKMFSEIFTYHFVVVLKTQTGGNRKIVLENEKGKQLY